MKFPEAILDVGLYQKKIQEMLLDDECLIFLDTNIFARYYGLHNSARQEFGNWSKPLIMQGRIKVPVWVLHEYTNRFIRNQTQDYFGPINKLATIVKEFVHVKEFLTMSSSASETAFLNDLKILDEKLTSVHKTAKSKNGNHSTIHSELEALFKNAVLKSNIAEITERAQNCGPARFAQKMPPGFEDSDKPLNSLGDLIIWFEILDYCKTHNVKKVIFLTNDNKKDLMYAPPQFIHDNGKELVNTKPFYKVADPRLVHEFSLATGADDFFIIDFKTLTKSLLANGIGTFINMAGALQLLPSDDEEGESDVTEDNSVLQPEEIPTTTDLDEPEAEVEPETNVESTVVSEHLTTNTQNVNDIVELNEFSRSDIGSYIDRESPISAIIWDLSEYDWYAQNDAIEMLREINLSKLPKSVLIRNHLFNLGIGIYESACGGGWKAVDYLKFLQTTVTELDNFSATFIIAGMLHEIYFDSENKFRYDNLKRTFALDLMKLQTEPRVALAFKFIEKTLDPFRENLVLIPSTSPSQVEIVIHYCVETVEGNPEMDRANVISDITSGQKSLVHDNVSRFYRNPLWGVKFEIEASISEFFIIPTNQLVIHYDPEEAQHYDNYFRLNKEKSLGINGPHANTDTNDF